MAARNVVNEMTEMQASATEIGVAEFMSQLDSSATQGLDDLNFGDDERYGATEEEEEVAEKVTVMEGVEEEVTEVEAPKKKAESCRTRGQPTIVRKKILHCAMLV